MENTLHKEKVYSEFYKRLISFLLSLLQPCWSCQPPSTQEDIQPAQEKPWRLQCWALPGWKLLEGPAVFSHRSWAPCLEHQPKQGAAILAGALHINLPYWGSPSPNPSPPGQPLPGMGDQQNPRPRDAPSQAARQSRSCLPSAAMGRGAPWTPSHPPCRVLDVPRQETACYNRWDSTGGLRLGFHVWSLKVPRQHRSSAELSLINVTAERILWAQFPGSVKTMCSVSIASKRNRLFNHPTKACLMCHIPGSTAQYDFICASSGPLCLLLKN